MAFLDDLKTELDAGHPNTGAYSTNAAIAATEINNKNRTRSKTFLSGSEILNATDDVEFGALVDINKDRWLALCAIDNVNTSSGIAKALEADIFGAGTTTRSNLVAIKNESVSRATELDFTNVREADILDARKL